MIPKVIHYCWFGGNLLPESAKRCIESWKLYCPEYEIVEWNENNFDVNENQYCKEAYECKKWAFVTDYVRLKILHLYGGIYMDTDVEVCKSFDNLLSYNACSGFESDNGISTGMIAASKDNEWIKSLLDYYNDRHFVYENENMDLTTNVVTITNITIEKYGLVLNGKYQVFGNNNAIFPFEYFCAKSLDDGKIYRNDNTYTIHHFSGSWLSPWRQFRHTIKIILVRLFGIKLINSIRNIIMTYIVLRII